MLPAFVTSGPGDSPSHGNEETRRRDATPRRTRSARGRPLGWVRRRQSRPPLHSGRGPGGRSVRRLLIAGVLAGGARGDCRGPRDLEPARARTPAGGARTAPLRRDRPGRDRRAATLLRLGRRARARGRPQRRGRRVTGPRRGPRLDHARAAQPAARRDRSRAASTCADCARASRSTPTEAGTRPRRPSRWLTRRPVRRGRAAARAEPALDSDLRGDRRIAARALRRGRRSARRPRARRAAAPRRSRCAISTSS